jgi:hypothetical protein
MSDLISAAIVENDRSNDEITLAEHAEVIRVLGRRVKGDVIEIGRRLTICKTLCGHGGWLPWLKREFGWSADTALRFMQVADFTENRNLRDLEIPVSGLYHLAAPSTPEAARDEVIERSEAGERLTSAQVKETIAKAVKAELDTKLKTVHAEYERREATIRAEYEGRIYLTPAQQQAQIDKAMAPLRKQIKTYEEKLAKVKERDDARARNGPHPTPAADNGAEPAHEEDSAQQADEVESSRTDASEDGGEDEQPDDETVESPRPASVDPADPRELPSNLDRCAPEPAPNKIEAGRRYELRIPKSAGEDDCTRLTQVLENLRAIAGIETVPIEGSGGLDPGMSAIDTAQSDLEHSGVELAELSHAANDAVQRSSPADDADDEITFVRAMLVRGRRITVLRRSPRGRKMQKSGLAGHGDGPGPQQTSVSQSWYDGGGRGNPWGAGGQPVK